MLVRFNLILRAIHASACTCHDGVVEVVEATKIQCNILYILVQYVAHVARVHVDVITLVSTCVSEHSSCDGLL